MEITDEMREYARAQYGPAMTEWLAAADRMGTEGQYRGLETRDAAGHRLAWARPGADVMHVYMATEEDDAALVSPAVAMRHAWDVLFVADAVRFGWLT